MEVSIRPGQTQLIRTPSGPWSSARLRVSRTTPPLAAQYAARVCPPRVPAVDAMLTMQPEPAAIMAGRNVLHVRNVPLRLTSTSRSQSFSASSVMRCSKNTPATLTSSHGEPSVSSTLLAETQHLPLAAHVAAEGVALAQARSRRAGGSQVDIRAGHGEAVADESGGDGTPDLTAGTGHDRDVRPCHMPLAVEETSSAMPMKPRKASR